MTEENKQVDLGVITTACAKHHRHTFHPSQWQNHLVMWLCLHLHPVQLKNQQVMRQRLHAHRTQLQKHMATQRRQNLHLARRLRVHRSSTCQQLRKREHEMNPKPENRETMRTPESVGKEAFGKLIEEKLETLRQGRNKLLGLSCFEEIHHSERSIFIAHWWQMSLSCQVRSTELWRKKTRFLSTLTSILSCLEDIPRGASKGEKDRCRAYLGKQGGCAKQPLHGSSQVRPL